MKFLIGAVGALTMSAMCTPCFAWTQDGLIALAHSAVKSEVLHQTPPKPSDADAPLPVFVTIERQGRVIGCRGTLRATQSSLEREVVKAARSATAYDPRYRPLTPADLKEFAVTVSVVQAQIPLEMGQIATLLPEEGLVLQSGERFGIVLPYEGRDPQTRLKWAWKKAGVAPNSPCRLFRLKADRFRG